MSSVTNDFTPAPCDYFPQTDSNPTQEIRAIEEKNVRDDCLALEQLMEGDLEVGRVSNFSERMTRYIMPLDALVARVNAINSEIAGPVMMKLRNLNGIIREMYNRHQEILKRRDESYFYNLA